MRLKGKELTNVRASALLMKRQTLVPPIVLHNLSRPLEFIDDDELVEVNACQHTTR